MAVKEIRKVAKTAKEQPVTSAPAEPNPFRTEPNRPVSRGVWATGGKLPLATLKETVTVFRPGFSGVVEFKREGTKTQYDFKDETLTLAAGEWVRVVDVIGGGFVARVIPGDFGCRAPGAPRLDMVEVPVEALA